jgi:anti-sigma-K factor RskA
MLSHDDYKEMLAAHGLGALEVTEVRELEAHLQHCADCRQEFAEWQATAASLAFGAAPIAPSPRVRDRIIDAVRAEGRHSANTKTVVVPFERRPQTAWTSLGSLGAIAAALALIGLIISLLILWQQNRAAQAEVARLAAEVRETSEQLAREREMVALITTPGARMAELAGTKEAPGAHAIVAYDKNGEAMLMAKGLPVAPAGKAYQLWFIKGGKPLPGRVFMSDPNGNGRMRDQVPSEALNDAVFAITLEPASGAQSPTGAIYLSSGS